MMIPFYEYCDMKLYAYIYPSRAERIVWVLNELQLECEIIRLNPRLGEHLQPEFKAINHYGKVPVLVDGDRTITESFAIAMYLCSLKTNTLLDAANTYTCMSHLMTEIEPILWQMTKVDLFSKQAHPEGLKDYGLLQLQPAFEQSFTWLQHHPFCAGAQFSLADIWFYHILCWGLRFGIAYPEHVQHYLQRLSEHNSIPAVLKQP